MKKILFLFIFYISFGIAESIETKIVYNIQNEIITNVDIKNEFKYLLALNNSLKELDKEKILKISNESIIREVIKKNEVSKYFKELKIDDEYLEVLLKNIYNRLNLKSLNEFEIYLKNYDLILNDIIRKVTIDALWNELIIQKYTSQITINEGKIRKEINKNKNVQTREYQLSEIIFEIKNKEEINKKYEEILKSINSIGFKNSASLYSFSESAKVGGNIGWINESSLNNKIKDKIINLKIEEISEPIILSNGILVLQVQNIKNSAIEINLETDLKKAINYERNRQLNQYSKIYFNKVKKNLEFNE